MLNKGHLIFDSYLDVFEKYDTTELNLTHRIDIADKIIELFRLCHSVLAYFCKNYKEYQGFMYKEYFHILTLTTKLNIGQIELMNEILSSNYEL